MPEPYLAPTIARLRDVLADAPQDALAKADDTATIGADEWFTFQQVQAEEHASGHLHTDDALTIHAALGGDTMPEGGWSPDADLATRIAVMYLLARLMRNRVAA
jgi:hypothetical protein